MKTYFPFIISLIFSLITPVFSQNPTLFKEIKKDAATFPTSISVSDSVAVVSAGWENTSVGNKAGAVYVYEYDGNDWVETQRLISPQGQYDGIFGVSVATDGKYIVVTEPNAQSAHIFIKNGSLWELDKTFTVTDNSTEKYGVSCDVSGNTVIIGSGAIFATYCNAIGSVYVYENNNGQWTNATILTPHEGKPHDEFAESVRIKENTIVVGARKSECYAGEQGYACVYEKENGTWNFFQKIFAPDGVDGNGFGASVDFESNQLVISAGGVGAVYIYNKGANWEFNQKLESPTGAKDDGFGSKVSIDNNLVIVSAAADDDIHANSGAVYLFKNNGDEFQQESKIKPDDTWENRRFSGNAMKLKNNFAFIAGGANIGILDIYKMSDCYCEIYDTVKIIHHDTIFTEIMDTTFVTVNDTIPIYDSIAVTDTLIIDAVLTGIDSPDNINTLRIYPNPAKDNLYINTGDYMKMSGYQLKIINQIGAVVFETNVEEPLYEVNLSTWSGMGLYFVQVIDSGGNIIDIRKIILQ